MMTWEKIKLPKNKKDPKELLTDIAATEVQYKCKLNERKKPVVVLQVGRNDYSVIMTMTGSMEKLHFQD